MSLIKRVEFFSELPKLKQRIEAKERRVLFRTGGVARKAMMNLLSRRPPSQFTQKTKRVTKRWQREVLGGAVRAPYQRTGLLRASVAFEVDSNAKSVSVGPRLTKKTTGLKPVPQLLNEGGSATVMQFGKATAVRYRAFPYVAPVFDKAVPKFLKMIETEAL